MLSTIIEAAVGVLAGFFSLFISHALIAPRMDMSQDIRIYWTKYGNRYTYSIRVKKRGFIDLINTQVQCRLYVRDVLGSGSSIWDNYKIPTSITDRLIFNRGGTRIFLNFHEFWPTAAERHPLLAATTKIHIPDVGLRAEDFFMSHARVYLRLFILGSDRFTGVTKVFESPKYEMRNLRFGDWDGMFVRESLATRKFAAPAQT